MLISRIAGAKAAKEGNEGTRRSNALEACNADWLQGNRRDYASDGVDRNCLIGNLVHDQASRNLECANKKPMDSVWIQIVPNHQSHAVSPRIFPWFVKTQVPHQQAEACATCGSHWQQPSGEP